VVLPISNQNWRQISYDRTSIKTEKQKRLTTSFIFGLDCSEMIVSEDKCDNHEEILIGNITSFDVQVVPGIITRFASV